MKVLLINVDSKIPNLALMKLSAFHKSIGDNVSFENTDEPELVYASVIFKKNKHMVDGLKFFYPNARIVIGGSGYDIKKQLPAQVECMKPDYAIYSDCDYSLGFSSRGCNRNCSFCIVPKKEGAFKRADHPRNWHNPNFDKIVFLDNNILFDKEWFFEVTDYCIENNLKTWFMQGLDIRLLDQEIADRIKQLRIFKSIFFAWDDIKTESIILKKIKLLETAGINIRSNVVFYVYCDSSSGFDYDSTVYRCRKLKELGTNPFVMFNIDKRRSKEVRELQRWANRKWCFWSCDIVDYKR